MYITSRGSDLVKILRLKKVSDLIKFLLYVEENRQNFAKHR